MFVGGDKITKQPTQPKQPLIQNTQYTYNRLPPIECIKNHRQPHMNTMASNVRPLFTNHRPRCHGIFFYVYIEHMFDIMDILLGYS